MSERDDSFLCYLRRPSRRRLERVVRDYHEHVWRVAFRVTAHAEDAQDICQDVFLRLLLEPPAAAEVRSPGGYLAWCVVGRAGKLRRAGERRAAREREAAARIVEREMTGDEAESLRAELLRLPDDLRLPLELRYLAGLANAEVASALGLPLRTLEQRLHEARDRLRRRLAPLLLGAAGVLATFEEALPAAPPALLPELLRVVREGAALSAAVGAGLGVITGGVVMTKKAIVVASALAVLLASVIGSVIALRREPHVPPDAPVVAASAPQAPVAPLEAVPIAPEVGKAVELPPEPPRASLRGVVKDEEGNVVAGASVGFRDHIPAEHAEKLRSLGYRDLPAERVKLDTTADAEGAFSFAKLLPGEASVLAEAPGLHRSGPEIELEAGKTTWQMVTLNYLRRLHGRVLDPDGAPVPHATVLIRKWSVAGSSGMPMVGGENHEYVAFAADAQGGFDTGACLERMPQPGQDLLAWGEGLGMNAQRPPLAAEGRYVASIELILEPEMPVRIAVRDPQGRAVEGVAVGAAAGEDKPRTLRASTPYPLCVTDAHGAAHLRHLARKKQALLLARSGFHTACLDLTPDGPASHTVILQPEAAGAELTVRLNYEEPVPDLVQRWGVLSLERAMDDGSFRAAEGNPVELDHRLAAVTFHPSADGRYRCRLSFRHGGEIVGEPFEHLTSHPQAVELDVALPGPYVAGVLLDATTGSPVTARYVVAHFRPRGKPPRTWTRAVTYGGVPFPRIAGSARGCSTDAGGRFLLLLPRDECPLEVSVRHDEARRGWAGPEELEINADDRVTDLRLELRAGGAIEGQVLDAAGAPVPGEAIVAYDGGANAERKTSDAEGKLRFDGLRPGAYALEAIGVLSTSGVGTADGFEGFEAGVLDPEEVFDRRVTVREGETTAATIVLERDRLGAIEGVLGEGLPRKGTIEHCVLLADQPWEVFGWQGTHDVSDGAFRLEHLHAGRYRLTFRAPGIGAGAIAEVRRGHVARIVMRPASGVLSIPLPALDLGVAGELKVAALQRRGRAVKEFGAWEPWSWKEWTEHSTERRDESLVISGLPSGIWRARVESPHLPDAWTEPAIVLDGSLTETSALVFSEPCSAIVRCELYDGSPVPAGALVVVYDLRGGVTCGIEIDPDVPSVRRLTKLPAGTFTLVVEWQGRRAEAQLAVREGELAEARLVVPRG